MNWADEGADMSEAQWDAAVYWKPGQIVECKPKSYLEWMMRSMTVLPAHDRATEQQDAAWRDLAGL